MTYLIQPGGWRVRVRQVATVACNADHDRQASVGFALWNIERNAQSYASSLRENRVGMELLAVAPPSTAKV